MNDSAGQKTELRPANWAASLQSLSSRGLRFGSYIDLGCADGYHGLLLWHLGLLPNVTIINVDANPLYEPSLRRIHEVIGGHYRICAVAEHSGTIELHASTHPYWASALEVGNQYWDTFDQQTGERLEVPCRTLDSLVDELTPKPPYILKLDIQGLEARVLRSGPRTLANTAVVVCEIVMNDFRAINAVIEQAGFDIYDLTDMHRTDDHRLAWLYAIYVHRNYGQWIPLQMWTKDRSESVREMQEWRRRKILANIDEILSQRKSL